MSEKKRLTAREKHDLDRKQDRQTVDRIKRSNPALPHKVTMQRTIEMNRSSSGIAGILDGLKSKIHVLNQEIKADEKGKKDYEDELKKLSIKKEDIQSRLNRNREWASNFDTDIGPFQAKYARMTEKMADRYDIAKAEHLKGLQVLMDEFQYHPEYKRYSDNFTAVPFRPK